MKDYPLRDFRIAFTGDFLDESAQSPMATSAWTVLASQPFLRWHFITDLGAEAE